MANTPAPLNTNDTAFSTMDQFKGAGGGSIVTINPGDTITNGVQNYKYANNPTVFRNSQYFSGNNATSASPTATSPDAYGHAVDNLGNNIDNAANTPPVISTGFGKIGYDPGQDPQVQADVAAKAAATKAQETQLQLERDQEVKRLQDEQAAETQQLGETQANETGSTSRNLLYLQQGGQSASAQAYLNQLEVSHTREMGALNAKYTTAIQQAQNAFTDKDFALAEKYTADAKAIKDDAYKRNQDFIDNTLKIQAEARQEATAQFEQQKAQQTFNKDNKVSSRFYQYPGSPVVFDSISGQPVTADEYAAARGVGQNGKYADIQVIDPEANAQHSPAYVEWQDYLKSGGKFMSFSDYQTMDANRKAKIAAAGAPRTYNENKDAAQTTAQSKVGAFLAGKAGPKDGYVSPEDFKTARSAWIQDGYSSKDFDSVFGAFVNPADAQDYGNSFVTKVSSNQ